jgi:hypothetical protein
MLQDFFIGEEFGDDGRLILNWLFGRQTITMDVKYQINEERIELVLFMPDGMWFSIGFGSSMVETDMIAFFAQGGDSYVEDYWSTQKGAAPRLDT